MAKVYLKRVVSYSGCRSENDKMCHFFSPNRRCIKPRTISTCGIYVFILATKREIASYLKKHPEKSHAE